MELYKLFLPYILYFHVYLLKQINEGLSSRVLHGTVCEGTEETRLYL